MGGLRGIGTIGRNRREKLGGTGELSGTGKIGRNGKEGEIGWNRRVEWQERKGMIVKDREHPSDLYCFLHRRYRLQVQVIIM